MTKKIVWLLEWQKGHIVGYFLQVSEAPHIAENFIRLSELCRDLFITFMFFKFVSLIHENLIRLLE